MDAPAKDYLIDIPADLRAPLEDLFGEGWPERWEEVAYILYGSLLDGGLPAECTPEVLAAMAVEQLHALCRGVGGRNFYLAKGAHVDAKRLAQLVVQEFDGCNYERLMLMTGLSYRRIEQILDEHRKSRQRALFD